MDSGANPRRPRPEGPFRGRGRVPGAPGSPGRGRAGPGGGSPPAGGRRPALPERGSRSDGVRAGQRVPDERDQAAAEEARLCGLGACLAVFAKRPEAIIRAYVTQAQLGAAAELLRWCAARRRAYHVVTSEEMGRITQSTHHEGICLVVKPPAPLGLEALCMRLAAQTGPMSVLLLEGVTNPHNLGAILRVAAHFGAAAVVQCGPRESVPRLSAAVCRTAEGAAEHVPVVNVRDGRAAVQRLRRCALEVVATSSHAGTTLYDRRMPPRCLVLLGSESEGLSPGLLAAADAVVAIPGTGTVESLNVACAAAVILAEFRRVTPLPGPAAGTDATPAP